MTAKKEIPKGNPAPPKPHFWSSDVEAILGIMLVLIVIGTINIYSSSFIMWELNPDTANTPYFFLKRHLGILALSTVVFIIVARTDYRAWRNFVPVALLITIILLIVVLLFGTEVNGARRWLPFISFQPAECAKLIAIMMTSSYLASRTRGGLEVCFFSVPLGAAFVMAVLTELEPDMGTACVIFGVPLLLVFIGGLHPKKILALGVIGIVGITAMILSKPYRLQRVLNTWDPWQDAQNVGYQTVQSISTIGSGEIWGMGLGTGMSKYSYLPEGHTDFAFAIFCQENGFVGALLVFFLYAALAVYIMRILRATPDFYGKFLAGGIMLLIVGQGVINLLMVGGSFPVVGVPLPFISYGGTALLMTMTAMGLLVSIGTHTKDSAPRKKPKERPALRLVHSRNLRRT